MRGNVGVYTIRNIMNKAMYVGSSKNLKRRLERHRSDLRHNKHHSVRLQRAWNKYGEKYFEFFVMEYCEEDVLLENEQWWLDNATCTYNMSRKADRPELSAEARKLIGEKVKAKAPANRAIRSQRAKDYIARNPQQAAEHLARLHSEAARAKVKAAHRERNRTYSAFGKLWCLKELSETYGVHYGMLKDRIRAGWDVETAVTTPKRKGGL